MSPAIQQRSFEIKFWIRILRERKIGSTNERLEDDRYCYYTGKTMDLFSILEYIVYTRNDENLNCNT